MRYLAFDLEMTGLDTGVDRIIEFCFLFLNSELEVTERFQSLVNPGRPIPKETTAIHGLTDADVADVPGFSMHAERIQKLIEKSVLIAHNGSFDMAVLNAELLRCNQAGISPSHPLIDTLLIERYVNSHKLSEAYVRYENKTFDGAHRAEADALATVAVLKGQRRTFPERLPSDMESMVASNIKELAGYEKQTFLDHDHRFYKDSEGVVRFNFSQHKGEEVQKRRGYLEWMVRREFSEDTLRVVKSLLAE